MAERPPRHVLFFGRPIFPETAHLTTYPRLRRLAVAALVGAAVVVWPGFPSARALAYQPPPYERALRWRDVIRLRLSPWLLNSSDEPAP